MSKDRSLRENVTHGTPRRPLRALHFTAGPGTGYPDRFFVEQHWHDYVEILLIRKGDYLIEINLEEHLLPAGTLCILNSGELHQIRGLSQDAVHDALLFDPQILNFSYEDAWEEEAVAPFLRRELMIPNLLQPSLEGYPELLFLSKEMVRQALSQKDGWYLQCKLLLINWFALLCSRGFLLPAREKLSGADTRKISRYKTLISYMEQHYQEPLSLEELSELIGCSGQYLCRFFREIAGVSPIRYLIALRTERACSQLLCTGRSVTDIALDCGFDNISYFIRKFREQKGCTPGQYRKRSGLPEDAAQSFFIHEEKGSGIRTVPEALPRSEEAGCISPCAPPGRERRS